MSVQADLQTAIQLARQGRHKAAFKAARAGMKRHKGHPAFPNVAGIALCAMDRAREAVPLFQSALKLDPAFHDARRNLAQAMLTLDRPEAAARHLAQVTAALPADMDARVLLGAAQARAGAPAEALETLAALDRPGATAHALRAEVLETLGRLPEATTEIEAALAQKPGDAALWARLSAIEARQARPDAALAAINRAVALAPDDVTLRLRQVAQLLSSGEPDSARGILRELHAAQPLNPDVIEELALLGPAEPDALHEAARTALRALPRGDSPARAALCFALAHLSAPEAAEAHLAEGNRVMAALTPYDPAREAALDAAILDRLATPLPALTQAPMMRAQPIFVLGLPRAGTTLAEAVLGAHPAVAPLGERRSADLLHPMVQPDAAPIDAGALAAFVSRDQSALPPLPESTLAYVDKMPENHRWIGLLRAAYPQGRFMHLSRDPRDTALSMWQSRFGAGALGYTYDWSRMAHRFNLYAAMMAHWRQLFPDAILEVSYEDLVADIYGTSRRIAEFCGLDWTEAMTRPDLHAGQVRTRSVYQLRQPVHGRSVGKWRGREDLLRPFTDRLDPTQWPGLA